MISSSVRRDATSAREDVAYLNHASASPFAPGVVEVMLRQLEAEAQLGKNAARSMAQSRLDASRKAIAELLGSAPDEIAFGETNTGLWGAALTALLGTRPLRVVTVRNEWGAHLLTLQALAARGLVEVDVRPTQADGRFDLRDVASTAAGADVVSVPLLPSLSGMRNDIGALKEELADTDTLLFVDGAQAVGQLEIDTSEVDILTFPARKWLGGPKGAAAMHVSERARDRMGGPLILDQGGGSWSFDGYVPHADARRFERYDFDVAARLGLGRAAEACLTTGPAQIEARIADLSRHLVDLWTSRGLPPFLERPGPLATGIWTFTCPEIADHGTVVSLGETGVVIAGIGPNYGRLAVEDRGADLVLRLSIHHTDHPETLDMAVERISTLIKERQR